jgi:hypothetical protein
MIFRHRGVSASNWDRSGEMLFAPLIRVSQTAAVAARNGGWRLGFRVDHRRGLEGQSVDGANIDINTKLEIGTYEANPPPVGDWHCLAARQPTGR